jgi:hypothetical protein
MKYQNAEELYKIFAVMIEKVKKDQELTNKLVCIKFGSRSENPQY